MVATTLGSTLAFGSGKTLVT